MIQPWQADSPVAVRFGSGFFLRSGLVALLSLSFIYPVHSARTTGTVKLLAIRVNFNDVKGGPSLKTVEQRLNSARNQFSAFSFGRLNLACTVTKVLALPKNRSSYNGLGLARAAEGKAKNAGYNTGSYSIIGFYYSGGSVGAHASVGGKRYWAPGNGGSTMHEMGHVFGFPHQNYWNPGAQNPIGAGKLEKDVFSFMTSAGIHPEPYEKWRCKWITKRHDVSSNGSFRKRLYNFDNQSIDPANAHRTIRVNRVTSTKKTFWLGYRSKSMKNKSKGGINTALRQGLIFWWGRSSGSPVLLDIHTSSTLDDRSLQPGETFSDTAGKVHITNLGRGGKAPNEYLDVQINRGSFTGNKAPVVSWDLPSTWKKEVPLQIQVEGSDPDGDKLVCSWKFQTGGPTANNTNMAITKKWVKTGKYSVTAVVSDMKGKKVTLRKTITIANSFPTADWIGVKQHGLQSTDVSWSLLNNWKSRIPDNRSIIARWQQTFTGAFQPQVTGVRSVQGLRLNSNLAKDVTLTLDRKEAVLNLHGSGINADGAGKKLMLSGPGSILLQADQDWVFPTKSGLVVETPIQLLGRNLNISVGGTSRISGGIHGDGVLKKSGSGTLIMEGESGHIAPTTVFSGTLQVDGSLSASPVTVTRGGILSGTGIYGNTVTVNPKGALSPGSPDEISSITLKDTLQLDGDLVVTVDASAEDITSDRIETVLIPTGTGEGRVLVTNMGPSLVVGQSFKIFSKPFPKGGNMSVESSVLVPELGWGNNLAVDGSITVVGASYPLKVSTDGGGIATGSGIYGYNTRVSISATPFVGFTFSGWIGEGVMDPDSPSTIVEMSRSRTVKALFTRPDRLIAYWKLNEASGARKAVDSSVHDNDLSVKGSVSGKAGLFGKAFSFAKKGDRLSMELASPYFHSRFTLSAWAKASSLNPSDWSGIFNNGDSGDLERDFQLITLDNRYQYSGDSGVVDFGPVTKQWVHFAVVSGLGKTTLYRNGMMVGEVEGTSNVFQRYEIGTNPDHNKSFVGLIDDVALFKDDLPPSEIAAIHALGRFSGVTVNAGIIHAALHLDPGERIIKVGQGMHTWTHADGLVGDVGSTGGTIGDSSAYVVLHPDGSGIRYDGLNGVVPIIVSYPENPARFGLGIPVDATPVVTGQPSALSIEGLLPDGIVFDEKSGKISGTPLKLEEERVFSIKAVNEHGESASFHFPVSVIDLTPPVITLNGEEHMTLNVGETFTEPGATGLDNVDGHVPVGSSLDFPGQGLIAHWSLDEVEGTEVADASGRDVNGEIAFGATLGASGKKGGAISFDGVKGWVDFGDVAIMDKPARFTFSTWFLRRSETATPTNHDVHNILLAQSSTNSNDNLEVGTHGSMVEIYIDAGSSTTDPPTETTLMVEAGIQDDTWHHLALTYDTGDATAPPLKLYVDGALVQSWEQFRNPLETSDASQLSLGVSRPKGAQSGQFHGLQDETALWNRALSSNEVKAIHTDGNIDTTIGGERVITYTAIDTAGNISTSTRTVIVIDDPEPPFISLLGTGDTIIRTGMKFVDEGAIAGDDVDGDLSSYIIVNAGNPVNVDTSVPGIHFITYDVKDFAGNSASQAVRRVTVVPPGFAAWLEVNEMAGMDAIDTSHDGDPDNDGMINLIEYAFGGNPLIPGLQTPMSLEVESGALRLNFVRMKPSLDPSLSYSPQVTANLQLDWNDVVASVVIAEDQSNLPDGNSHANSTYERVTVTVDESDVQQFLRIIVDFAQAP